MFGICFTINDLSVITSAGAGRFAWFLNKNPNARACVAGILQISQAVQSKEHTVKEENWSECAGTSRAPHSETVSIIQNRKPFMQRTIIKFIGLWSVCVLFGIQSTFAAMMNITTPDGTPGAVFPGSSTDISGEDNETEPGTLAGQEWDLERVVWDQSNKKLIILGGFDYANGVPGYNFHTGDIFIDTDGNILPVSSTGNYQSISNPDYEYVIHFKNRLDQAGGYKPTDFDYDVYKLDSSSQLLAVKFDVLDSSNPFIYSSGGTLVAGASGTGTTATYGTDAAVNAAYGSATDWANVQGYGGNTTHYELNVGLGWLAYEIGQDPDILHFTIGCGNDYIRANFNNTGALTQAPDGGMTILLFGIGLTGIAVIRSRISKT